MLRPAPGLLNEAKRIARAHGMFIVIKGDVYLLYRQRADAPNVLLGRRSSAHSLRKLVQACALSE